jgi:hypothetical protein
LLQPDKKPIACGYIFLIFPSPVNQPGWHTARVSKVSTERKKPSRHDLEGFLANNG